MAATLPFWDHSEDGYYAPDYAPSPWDVLVINKERMPGRTDVQATPSRRVDQKQEGGSDGASPTVRGYQPTQVQFTVHLVTPRHWQLFQALAAKLWPATGKQGQLAKATPFEVYMPQLALWRVTAVLITKVGTPVPGPVAGTMAVKIEALEYRPKGKRGNATTTPTVAVPVAPQFDDKDLLAKVPPANVAKPPPSKTDAGP